MVTLYEIVYKKKKTLYEMIGRLSPIKSPPNPNSINIKLLLAVAAGVLSPVTVGLVSVLSALSQPFASSSRLSSLFVCLSSIGLSFKIN
ncbi:unnamed protein product [Brassica rapa subsp. narinosa]